MLGRYSVVCDTNLKYVISYGVELSRILDMMGGKEKKGEMISLSIRYTGASTAVASK